MSSPQQETQDKPPSRTRYGFTITLHDKRVSAVFNGETIATSARAVVLNETRLPPVFYFPREDVRMDLLSRTTHQTHCPFKGNAAYWSIEVGDKTAENAVWSYEHPIDDAAGIKEHVAFIWDSIDTWLEDDQEIYEQDFEHASYESNPFAAWFLQEAWRANTPQGLVEALANVLVREDVPVWRLRLLVRTLNPQLFASAYTWESSTKEVETILLEHGVLEDRKYLESPFAAILDGAGGVRRRLEGKNPVLDYPILQDLHAQGCTDYVAMPMHFSDGQINIITLVSDQKGGFSTQDLGHIYEIMPTMSRLFEVHAQRSTAITLLDTYLGKHTGERVLDGVIKRGDGEDLSAVIWYCDLRDSTSLTETMPSEEYLSYLNQFFDCMAGAVLDHEGEVLKYIGDAVLAIFPSSDCSESSACEHAIEAARDARHRVDTINQQNLDSELPALNFGLAMHFGKLMYGNVGTQGRLDFTVIGAAVNEAARIEGMSKSFKESVLISEVFAKHYPQELRSLGRHSLRGVSAEQELFALPQEKDEN